MKLNMLILSIALSIFSMNSFATNVDEWIYKEVTGNLKSNPGCLAKEVAIKKATKPYRFHKYSKLLCNNIGYGWGLVKILDKGTVVCDECGGEYEGKYRCHAQDVKVKCKQVKRSW